MAWTVVPEGRGHVLMALHLGHVAQQLIRVGCSLSTCVGDTPSPTPSTAHAHRAPGQQWPFKLQQRGGPVVRPRELPNEDENPANTVVPQPSLARGWLSISIPLSLSILGYLSWWNSGGL